MTFFGDTSIFVREGSVGNWPARLNARYRKVIEENRDAICGKRILDLGSHDGRWMHALLHNGAAHVTGVEGRTETAHRGIANLSDLGYSRDRFDVLIENFNDGGKWTSRTYDTALVMGVLYHTHSPINLLSAVAGTRPRTLIVDTAVSLDPYPSMRVKIESGENLGSGIPSDDNAVDVIVAHPSRSTVELVLNHLGYEVEVRHLTAHDAADVPAPVSAAMGINPGNPLGDYFLGRRLIFVATRI